MILSLSGHALLGDTDPDGTRQNLLKMVSVLRRGMVRVDPQQSDALVATTTASLVEMRGRPMPGWLHVSCDDLLTDDQLTPWVERSTGYARSLPPKQ